VRYYTPLNEPTVKAHFCGRRGVVDEARPLHGWLRANGATAAEMATLRCGATEQESFGVNFYPWSAHELTTDDAGTVQAHPVPRDGWRLADVLRRCYTHTGRAAAAREAPSLGLACVRSAASREGRRALAHGRWVVRAETQKPLLSDVQRRQLAESEL
jgi:hypothetical protein